MTIYFYQFSNEKQKQCFFSKTRFAKFDKIKCQYKIPAIKESYCEIEINYTTILILYQIKCTSNANKYIINNVIYLRYLRHLQVIIIICLSPVRSIRKYRDVSIISIPWWDFVLESKKEKTTTTTTKQQQSVQSVVFTWPIPASRMQCFLVRENNLEFILVVLFLSDFLYFFPLSVLAPHSTV